MPATPTDAPTRLRGHDVGIPPRRLDFRHSPRTPRYFYDGNRTASTMFVTLSGAFPPGEQFFVDSVQRYRDRVTDPVQRAQVLGFVGQEAIHSREHDRLNELLRDTGMDVATAERAVELSMRILRMLPGRFQLVCTAFMEHFTALLAEELLTDEEFQGRGDQELLQLWLWHALEELEHKSVTYEVLDLVGNRRLERVLATPVVAVAVLPAVLAGWVNLLVREGALVRPADLRDGLRTLFGRRGLITRILGRMGLFNRSDFHPDRRDTSALEAEWRDRLFGDAGTLTDQVRHLRG